eukprot:TRINITY_DN4499_c0_g1_i5.p2 TRINITY_DN4499_c0_g1~~TRINITY_DN4499_c0_g1_i5.p2  ORF type:complete len:349 (-),score=58.07 TRINITY_DN4499_c0_g1_i5:203-1165(-)
MAVVCAMMPPALFRFDVYAWRPPPTERCGPAPFCQSLRSSSWPQHSCATSATRSYASNYSGDEGAAFLANADEHVSHHQQAKTFFRRWTVDATDPDDLDELVPGLRAAFKDAGMGDHCNSAEKWCLEVGAAFLSEVLEEVDDLFMVISPETSPSSVQDDEEQEVGDELANGPRQGDGRLQDGGIADDDRQAQIEQLRAALQMRCAQLAQHRGRPVSPSFGQHISPVQPIMAGKVAPCVVRRLGAWQVHEFLQQSTGAPTLDVCTAESGDDAKAASLTNLYYADTSSHATWTANQEQSTQQEKATIMTGSAAIMETAPRLW